MNFSVVTVSRFNTSIAENASKPSEILLSSPYTEPYWIVSEAVITSASIIALYFLATLSQYVASYSKRNSTRNLLFLVLLSLVTSLGRFMADQIVAFLGWQTDSYCAVSTAISFALYSISSCPIYVFLWLRQHKFYCDSKLKHLGNHKLLYYISRSTIALIILSAGSITILYQIPSVTGWKYQATKTGCRDANDELDLEILPFLANVVAFISQFALLGLLIYPLFNIRGRKIRMSLRNQAPKQESNSILRKAMLGNYHRRLSEGALQRGHSPLRSLSSPTQLHLTTKNVAASGNSERGTDDDVFVEIAASDVESEGFTSTEYDSEVEVSKRQPNYRKSSFHTTPVVYMRTPTNVNQIPKTTAKASYHSRTLSNTSMQPMLANKGERSTLRRNSSKNKDKSGRQLSALIQKVTILATVCVISDLLAAIIQLLAVVPELAYLALYDVNLIVNITCVLMSFKQWPQMVAPPWKQRGSRGAQSRSNSTSSERSIQTTSIKTTHFGKFNHRRGMSDTASSQSLKLSRPTTPESFQQHSRPNTPSTMDYRV